MEPVLVLTPVLVPATTLPIQDPANGLGKQQMMGLCINMKDPEKALGSQLWTGPALTVMAICGVNQFMKDLSLSLCPVLLLSNFDFEVK